MNDHGTTAGSDYRAAPIPRHVALRLLGITSEDAEELINAGMLRRPTPLLGFSLAFALGDILDCLDRLAGHDPIGCGDGVEEASGELDEDGPAVTAPVDDIGLVSAGVVWRRLGVTTETGDAL